MTLSENLKESRPSTSLVGAIAVPHPPLSIPAVGRGNEAGIQPTLDAYRVAMRALLEQEPDVLVVLSPHAPFFDTGFHVTTDDSLFGDMSQFRAPEARIYAKCDVDFAIEIIQQASEAGVPCVGSEYYSDDMDHGTFVPLYFACEATREIAEEAGEAAAGGGGEGGEGADGAGEAAESAASETRVTLEPPYPIVRIGLSDRSPEMHRLLGRAIVAAAATLGRRVGLIASGDLSHKLLDSGPYGFAPEGPRFDARVGKIFASGNLEELYDFNDTFCESAAECGLRAFQIMAGAVDGCGFVSHLLSIEGPFGVGYAVATVLPPEIELPTFLPEGFGETDADGEPDFSGLFLIDVEPPGVSDVPADGEEPDFSGMILISDGTNVTELGASDEGDDPEADGAGADLLEPEEDRELLLLVDYSAQHEVDPHVALARLAVETFTGTGEFAELPDDVDPELLEQRAGVFVSLHEHGELRGCIGTASPVTDSIAEEIMRNAVFACSDDPRFPPVTREELDHIDYSVDVLGEPERVATPLDLDPERYGVIVTKGWKNGLLLPNLDGIDTVEDQLRIAKQKAGIPFADKDVELERFEVVRHTKGGEARLG